MCALSDKAAEGAAWYDDGGRTLCGGDCQEAGDGFSDGNLQRHKPHLQDPAPDGCREGHQGNEEPNGKSLPLNCLRVRSV